MNDSTAAQVLRRYQRLSEISRDLTSTLELNALLKKIVRLSTEILKSQAASILLYDVVKDRLFFQAAANENEEVQMRGLTVPAESIAGWVATHREPAVVPDVHQDKRFFDQVEKKLGFDTHSLIAIPLISNNVLLGVLEVINKKEGIYDDEDKSILLALGAQAAVAIENTRLFHQWDMIANLVHELRTPLTSIYTIAYLLQKPGVQEEERIRLATIIHSEAQRLNDLTSTFLDLARLESGRISLSATPVDLKKLIIECCQVVQSKADEQGIDLRQDVPDDLPMMEADADKIKQVLLNLLSNAIKYNEPKGKVTIAAHAEGQLMLISVQDTGIGIASEDLAHVFEKFFRSHRTEKFASGTGLGLSISKKIIESHSGTLTVQSQTGKGSIFTIELPLRSTFNKETVA
ncbi:MAG TPA: ATP-binding protein [Longilinea sp.]|nr:ATP-binding protein [Longilinea sp.]